jgi:hypothetical protein
MRPARIALFLQLCLAAAAAAATPEQELQAEVDKLFPTIFTKCGGDHFSKQTLDITYGDAYFIGQYKDLAALIQISPPSQFDAKNNIQWKGVIRFTASRARSFAHGAALVRRGLVPPDKIDVWGDWRKAILSDYTYHVAKRNGVINVGKPRKPVISAINCSEVPKG